MNKTIQQIVQSVPEETAGLHVLSELQPLVPSGLVVALPPNADPQTQVAAAVQAAVTLACGDSDQSRILLEQMREVAARHPQHPIGRMLEQAAPTGGGIAQSLDSGTFPAVPIPGVGDDTDEGSAIDRTIDSGSFPPVDPTAEDDSAADDPQQTMESGTFPPAGDPSQTIDSDNFPAAGGPGQTLDSGTFPPMGDPSQTIDSDNFPAAGGPGQTLDSGTFPPAGDPNQTIDSDNFPGVGGPGQTMDSGTFPPAGDPNQTIDSDSFDAGDPGQTMDSGTFPTTDPNQTIDSDSFPGAGGPGQTMDSGTFPPSGIDQTIESDSFSGAPGPGQTMDSGTFPVHQSPDQTIESGSFGGGAGSVAGGSGSVSTGGKGHQTSRDIQATFDSLNIPKEEADRMNKLWGGNVGEGTKPSMTIKGAEQEEAARAKLRIQSRSVRNTGDKAALASDYELLKKLGEGGMGVVYAARQASINRTVALKMLKGDVADEAQQAKFLAEAVVTGDLDHPNIVPIYDLGKNEVGDVFYSMKRVVGTPWLDVIKDKSVGENLDIMLKVADAMAFAHSRGVVHRDLKPENVMLGEFGEVLVMDWGLALGTAAFKKSTSIKQSCSMGGTPAYMAPEMASGPFDKIGPRSDIYLLGAMLFEVVTGVPPHTGQNTIKCLFAASRNEIVSTEKHGELLDIALKGMATQPKDRYHTVGAFQDAIREYIAHSESIVMASRADEDLKEAEKSDDYQDYARALFGYQEAYELWDGNDHAHQGVTTASLAYAGSALRKTDFDLGVSLLDEKNPAHSELYGNITKAIRDREKRARTLRIGKIVVACMLLFILVGGGVAGVVINNKAKEALEQQAIAEKNAEEATKQQALAEESAEEAKKQQALAVKSAEEATKQQALAEESAEEAKKQQALALKSAEEAQRQQALAVKSAEEAKKQQEKAEKATEEAVKSQKLADEQRVRAEEQREQAEQARRAAEYEGYVARIGLASAKIDENAFGVAQQLLLDCPEELRNWEWGRLMRLCTQSVSSFDIGGPVNSVAYAPDGKHFAVGGWNGAVEIRAADTGDVVTSISYEGHIVNAVAWSPDGQRLAVASDDPEGFLKLFDAQTGAEQKNYVGHQDAGVSVVFSKDGTRLLTGSLDNSARLWDVESGSVLKTLLGHNWWVWSAAFSRDESLVVTASQDGTAVVWNLKTGDKSPPFTGHRGPVYSAAFSPDGEHVVTGGYDKRVLIWRHDEVQPYNYANLDTPNSVSPQAKFQALDGHTAAVRTVTFSADGQRVLSAGHDNTVKVWHTATGQMLKTLRGHDSWVRSCSFSVDDAQIMCISGSYDNFVKIWDIQGYEEARVLRGKVLEGHTDAILAARFSPEGDRIVTASRDRTAKTWDMAGAQELQHFEEGHGYLASSTVFFPDGKRLLTGAVDNTVRLWDVTTGTEIFRLDDTGRSAAVALSPGGKWILTGSNDRTAQLWHADFDPEEDATPEPAKILKGHNSEVTAVAFSPEGDMMFTGDASGRCILWKWDAENLLATQLHNYRNHIGRISAAVFLPDSSRVLTASEDKTVGQLDISAKREDTSRILKHPDSVLAVVLSPDGKTVVTSVADGTVWVWDVAGAKVLRKLVDFTPQQLERKKQLAEKVELRQLLTPADRDFLLSMGMVNGLSISPDGRRVMTAHSDERVVRIWNLETGVETLYTRPDGSSGSFLNFNRLGGLLWSAAFSPDGNHVITVGGADARLWDVDTADPRMSFSPQGAVASASFSPDGKWIVTGSWDNTARIWNASDGVGILKLEAADGHTGIINSAVFSPAPLWNDGKQWVLTGSEDGSAVLWDAVSGQVIRKYAGHTGGVRSATFSRDGQRILTTSADKTARVWNTSDEKQPLQVLGGEGVNDAHEWAVLCGAFSDSGDFAVTGSEDNSAKVWDVATGQVLFTLSGHTASIASVAFSPGYEDLRVLTGSEDYTAKLWDAQTGKEILTLKGHSQEITSVTFSPQGGTALTGSQDGTAILWLATEWRVAPEEDPLELTGKAAATDKTAATTGR